jgi:hypothetical protein
MDTHHSGKKDNVVPHINDSSTPLSIFLLYFMEIIALLVVQTNCYYQYYSDTLHERPSAVPDTNETRTFVFLQEQCQWTLLTRPTERLVSNKGQVLHAFL